MTVKDLKEQLSDYEDSADVVIVDWSNGREYDFTVGNDDDDDNRCVIGLV